MNRGALSGTLILVVLALGVLVWGAVDEAAPAAQNPNALGFSADSADVDGKAFIVLYDDGSWRYASTLVPPATITPLPSATPIPTNTPRPTATASATPMPTLAATDEPTVTPESTLPPLVPSATPTEAPTITPQPGVCTFLPVAGLNVRDAMWGAVIARFGADDNPAATPPGIRVQTIRAEARAIDGAGVSWIAFWLDEDTYGWVHGGYVTLAGACDTLPTTPAPLLVGPHLLFNARADALWSLLATSGIAKEVSGDGHLLATARALNPKVITIYRTTALGECAPDYYDGREWIDLLAAGWPSGATFYEPVNECGEHSRAYSSTFQIEMMQRANERGICLLLYAFGVGNPSIEFFVQTRDVWDYALAHECQPGRHHSLSWHTYGLGEPRENSWLFDGYKMRCAALPGYCEKVGIYFTEWEWYGEESDPVDCDLVRQNIAWARAEYKGSPVRAILLWSFGDLKPWRDLTACGGVLS